MSEKPGLYRRFKLFTYRRPHAWSALKRAAVVGGVTAALALKSRGLKRQALKSLSRSSRLQEKSRLIRGLMSSYGVSASRAPREARKLKVLGRAMGRLKSIRGRLTKRSHRLGMAAGVTGTAGTFWAGYPLARESGIRRDLRRRAKIYPPVTVIHKRRGKVVQVRYL